MSGMQCPNGHLSSESDFCSECGAKMASSPAPALTVECPVCGTPRAADVQFCEVCGYDFQRAVAPNQPVEALPEALPPTQPPSAASPLNWEVTATVEASLRSPESPEPPPDAPPLVFAISEGSNLIGRSSAGRGIRPEVSLDRDDAVSHRHALLVKEADGRLTLRDIGSSNGTRLNGVEVKPLVDHALKDGDEITIGHWTRLAVKAVNL